MPSPKPEDTIAPSILDSLRKLVERWTGAKARERANYQLYLGELCAALEVEGPRPAGSGYEYELPIKVVDREGKEGSNFVDLFKRDHFVLEAKDKEPGRSDELMLRKAYGQARSYVTHLPGTTPPYQGTGFRLGDSQWLALAGRWDPRRTSGFVEQNRGESRRPGDPDKVDHGG
jgi:hypothetical protein